MSGLQQTTPVIGIFASDKGPGDPERASLMGEAGRLFARRGVRLVCLAENDALPVPLITAARAAGGTVDVLADASIVLPPALANVPVSVVPERAARHAQLAAMSTILVVLPGSLASATALFETWSSTPSRPIVFLNRHRAFEVLRGFAGDVLSHAVPGYDRNLQFADTVEDLWNKVNWLLQQQTA
ncbi:hypothetical protein [Devosia sp. 63-57]|uniref:hypothetical protein n=1 Tax=Devosia sp. 63-57 TaxID=1895751 RepID=UPI00086D12A0|nr:hypothetical protein [Devosia sp. 63-57]ODT47272.1 MAG: hypothetical protein ABS74_13340 [Pelagibacterium sp. SCN 63-126]ODU89089.1 MAG: hypothetical protein ABT14_02215 [Pelagibacterium sp. SCN 63-17]OJX43020.1 MAG: hypothetical protein BGO80_16530 [Devosia sp. 63-57]